MREKDYVVIIGSANIDVAGYSHESLNYADSNPGKIKIYALVEKGAILHKTWRCWVTKPATERRRQ